MMEIHYQMEAMCQGECLQVENIGDLLVIAGIPGRNRASRSPTIPRDATGMLGGMKWLQIGTVAGFVLLAVYFLLLQVDVAGFLGWFSGGVALLIFSTATWRFVRVRTDRD